MVYSHSVDRKELEQENGLQVDLSGFQIRGVKLVESFIRYLLQQLDHKIANLKH